MIFSLDKFEANIEKLSIERKELQLLLIKILEFQAEVELLRNKQLFDSNQKLINFIHMEFKGVGTITATSNNGSIVYTLTEGSRAQAFSQAQISSFHKIILNKFRDYEEGLSSLLKYDQQMIAEIEKNEKILGSQQALIERIKNFDSEQENDKDWILQEREEVKKIKTQAGNTLLRVKELEAQKEEEISELQSRRPKVLFYLALVGSTLMNILSVFIFIRLMTVYDVDLLSILELLR